MKTYLDHPDLQATAQHILLVQSKIDRLNEAKRDSWLQILTAAARAYRNGTVTLFDLQDLHDEMKECYGSGYTNLWDAAMPIRASSLRHVIARARRDVPNGPNGSWMGTMSLAGASRPPDGVAVLYVLFDAANEPIYTGSSDSFTNRLAQHRNEKPEAVRWVAYPCRDREHAYRVEDKALREHKPRMNKRAGR